MIFYLQELTPVSGATAFEINPIAVFDSAQSVIWTRRYDTPGEFDLYITATAALFEQIKQKLGYLVFTREDSQEVMYVEYVKLTENELEGDYILIKGRSIDCVMERRVIGYPTTFTITPTGAAIKSLIEENMIEPTPQEGYTLDPLRRVLSPFRFVMPVVYGSPLNRTYNGENLLEAVGELLKKANCGLRCTLEDGEIIMQLYRGQDRPNVKFSPDNENLLSSEYECDIRGQCNTAFVYADGDEKHTRANGSNPYTVTRQYPPSQVVQNSNFMRYEGFMTGTEATTSSQTAEVTDWTQGKLIAGEPVSDESSVYCPEYIDPGEKISVSWTLAPGIVYSYCFLHFYDAQNGFISAIHLSSSGDTITPPAGAATCRIGLYTGIEVTLTPADVSGASYTALRDRPLAEYKTAVAEQGAALMLPKNDSLRGETIETGLYRIGVDYALGDTVRVENSYGITGTAKVSEITERWDAEGYHIYPTFTDWTVT